MLVAHKFILFIAALAAYLFVPQGAGGGLAIAASGSTMAPFCERWLSPRLSVLQAQREALNILLGRLKPVEEVLRNYTAEQLENFRLRGSEPPHAVQWRMNGVPSRVRLMEHNDSSTGMVFRHYTTPEALKSILESNTLQTGIAPYVEKSPGLYEKDYPDLTGVFLTLPQVRSRTIGMQDPDGKRFAYLDIRISEEIPVLMIDKDIFLIGLRPRSRDWLARLYLQDQAGTANPESVYTSRHGLAELRERHGPNFSPAAIPISIVGHGLE